MYREITHKIMTNADIPFLHKLLNEPEIRATLHMNETTIDFWHNAFMKWESDSDEENFIIYKENTPIGWISLNGIKNTEIAWVRMFAIHPDYQHQGIGNFVINNAVEYLESKGFNRVGIHTTEDNIPAHGCYRKCGFILIERSDCTNADGLARIGYTYIKRISNTPEDIKDHWYAYMIPLQKPSLFFEIVTI